MIDIFDFLTTRLLAEHARKAFMAHSGWYHVTLGLWPWRSDLRGSQMLRDACSMAWRWRFITRVDFHTGSDGGRFPKS